MFSRVSPRDFIAHERRQVVLEAIEGLEDIQRHAGLNRLQIAALDALVRLYTRSTHALGTIPVEAMRNPLRVAQRAMECAQ